MHVRDYTKGHPTVLANNHPIRHGSVVGIHNGIIVNDEEILARYAIERAEPEMTVDSEAIFALMELTRSDHAALEAAARLDGDRLDRRTDRRPAVTWRVASPGRSGSVGHGARSSSPRRSRRSKSSRERSGSRCASTRSPRAGCSTSSAAGSSPRPASAPIAPTATTGCCRRCARHTRASRASRSSLRSPRSRPSRC